MGTFLEKKFYYICSLVIHLVIFGHYNIRSLPKQEKQIDELYEHLQTAQKQTRTQHPKTQGKGFILIRGDGKGIPRLLRGKASTTPLANAGNSAINKKPTKTSQPITNQTQSKSESSKYKAIQQSELHTARRNIQPKQQHPKIFQEPQRTRKKARPKTPQPPSPKPQPPPNTPKHLSQWLQMHKLKELDSLNLSIKPKQLYTEDEWKSFSLSLDTQNTSTEISIQAVDKANHMAYIHKVLLTIGKKWFYHYAPIEQYAQEVLRVGLPIVASFTITEQGKITDIQLQHKGTQQIENIAILRTLEHATVPPPPTHIHYKNFRITFHVHPIEKQPIGTLVRASISIQGQYKTLP